MIYKATWKKLRFVLAADWPSEGRHIFVSGLAPMVRSCALGFGPQSVAIQTCPAPTVVAPSSMNLLYSTLIDALNWAWQRPATTGFKAVDLNRHVGVKKKCVDCACTGVWCECLHSKSTGEAKTTYALGSQFDDWRPQSWSPLPQWIFSNWRLDSSMAKASNHGFRNRLFWIDTPGQKKRG